MEELQIVKFNGPATDLLGLRKLCNLERLSLCATWFPLDIERQAEEGAEAVVGSRELEQIIYALRGSLTQISLGNYIWDDLVIYIAEMCKELEQV